MHLIDIILVICFIPAIINGLRKGLVSQVVSIISVILGVWISFRFYSALAGWMAGWLDGTPPAILNIAAFTVILIAVIFILSAIGKIIESSIKLIMLGWLNKTLGVIFAAVKCALFIGLAIILFNSLNDTFKLIPESKLSGSILYPPLKHAAYSIFPYLKVLLFK